jgi:hypothetical protein
VAGRDALLKQAFEQLIARALVMKQIPEQLTVVSATPRNRADGNRRTGDARFGGGLPLDVHAASDRRGSRRGVTVTTRPSIAPP